MRRRQRLTRTEALGYDQGHHHAREYAIVTRWILVAGIVLASAGLAGCRPKVEPLRPPMAPPEADGVPLNPFDPGQKIDNAKDFQLIIRFRLITVQVPLGAVSDSEELWSYVNEEPLGARVGAALANNGIRVGIGTENAWPDIAALLDRLTGKPLVRASMLAPPGATASILLKQNQGIQTIFMFRRDRTLVGNDYPPGDNMLMIIPNISLDDPSVVHLTGAPIIRSTRRVQRYVRTATGYTRTSKPFHFPLSDTQFQVKIPVGGFLLVGPGQGVRRASSPGNRFLVRTHKGLDFETIVVIAPEVFAAPVRKPS